MQPTAIRVGASPSASCTSAASAGWTPPSFTPRTSAWFDANNRLGNAGLGVQYDAAGNQTAIGAYTFTYDAENRLKSSAIAGAATTYAYDGEGRRVKKTAGGVSTVYAYNAAGELAAEYGGPAQTPGTRYLTTDHLGSTRLVTDANGNVLSRHDYLPFGEEVPAGVGGRTTAMGYTPNPALTQKFTGKVRDAETGLDYFGARYLSGAMGRWATADAPFADQYVRDPQSWNLYSYTRNNPLLYVDDDGEAVKENLVYRTYDVHGKTAAEAKANALAASGFKSDRGEPMTGLTSGGALRVTNLVIQPSADGFEGTFVTATQTVKSADVEINQTVTMPNWVEHLQASPEDQAAWNTAQAGLKAHEEGHVQINREAAQKLDRALPGMAGSGGASTSREAYKKADAQLTQKINQKVRSVSRERNTRQKTYDDATDHGRKKLEGN